MRTCLPFILRHPSFSLLKKRKGLATYTTLMVVEGAWPLAWMEKYEHEEERVMRGRVASSRRRTGVRPELLSPAS